MANYWTLLVKENGVWGPQFGSFEYQDLVAELQDYRSHGVSNKSLKIIRTDETQEAIDSRIKAINSMEN